MKTMRIWVLAPLLLILLCRCSTPEKKETKNASLDSTSTLLNDFIQSTNNASAIAIELSQLAAQSNNARIRSFADSVVGYYSGLQEEIHDLAVATNANPPDSMALVEIAAIKNLKFKTGLDFDRSFARMMNGAQLIIASQFRKAAKIKNERLRQIINTHFPELRKNITNLRNIRNELSGRPDKNALKRKEKNA
jgi:predicted outer membrane protein